MTVEHDRDYSDLRDAAVEAARESGDWLLTRFGHTIAVSPKGDDSVVTELDVQCERMIIERLRGSYPNHTIIGEELSSSAPTGSLSWAVDPIDGTRNFASGVPLWAVSIAALEQGVPVAGAAYIPTAGEMYEAARGQGARMNGKTLKVSSVARLSEAVTMADLRPDGLLGATLIGLVAASRRTRMFGSVCCGLCYVAAGRFDLYYSPAVNVWDVAAGGLLVEEAGGATSSLDGAAWEAESDSILAANRTLVEQFLTEKRRLHSTARESSLS